MLTLETIKLSRKVHRSSIGKLCCAMNSITQAPRSNDFYRVSYKTLIPQSVISRMKPCNIDAKYPIIDGRL